LRRADPPYKESYRLCIGSRNLKGGQGPRKGCRAIIIIIIIINIELNEIRKARNLLSKSPTG
jgi:hypothetical protein